MKTTQRKILLGLVHEGVIRLPTVGFFVYLDTRQGSIVTYNSIQEDILLNEKTARSYLRKLKKLGIVEITKVEGKGLLVMLTPTEKWLVGHPHRGSLSLSSISKNTRSSTRAGNEQIERILEHLNRNAARAGKSKFRNGEQLRKMISARMAEGYTVDDFLAVHENMRFWLDDPTMSQYYKPSTLYRKNNFWRYLETEHAVDKRKQTTSKFHTDDAKKALEANKEKRRRMRERAFGKGDDGEEA